MNGVESRGSPPISSPTITEGPPRSREGGALLKYENGESPPGVRTTAVILGLNLSGMAALIEAPFVTSVHPGVKGVRGEERKVEDSRWRSCEKRYNRMRERELGIEVGDLVQLEQN